MEKYLRSTNIIETGDEDLHSFIKDALEENDEVKKARHIFLLVRDSIKYDPYTSFYNRDYYKPGYVIKKGRAFCVPKAALLCAALRRAGIPARLGFADLQNQGATPETKEVLGSDVFAWHGFTELYLNGKWLKATPAFDKDLCIKHKIAPLEFDGLSDCVFPARDLEGKAYAKYLRFHGSYDDLPFEEIMNGWREIYGKQRVDMWIQAFEAGELDR